MSEIITKERIKTLNTELGTKGRFNKESFLFPAIVLMAQAYMPAGETSAENRLIIANSWSIAVRHGFVCC